MTAPADTTESPPRVLVADDQAAIIDALRLLLTDEGFEVDCLPDELAGSVYFEPSGHGAEVDVERDADARPRD